MSYLPFTTDAQAIVNNIDLSVLNDKTIMITGASGLIGTYLLFSLDEFVRQGGRIKKCYALIFSELPSHLIGLSKNNWIEFIRGDITDTQYLNTLPTADFIIHAATYGQPQKFMADPAKVIKINTLSTFELLNKLHPNGKFLFISSSAVYTGCSNLPFTENEIGCSNTNHPRAAYIEGKRCGEAIVNAVRISGTDAKSVRLQLAYGPGVRLDDARVINQFIRRALDEDRIDLLDDGSAERVYIYIADAVELMWKILLFGTSDIYNIAGHSITSIYQLAQRIGHILTVPVSNKNNEDAIGGAMQTEVLDMNKAEREFGKKEYVSLEEGLNKTIAWTKEAMLKENVAK